MRSWLEAQGLVVSDVPGNRLTLVATGTTASVEKALSVQIGRYAIGTSTFTANDRDPSLPADIAARVEAVAGLVSLASPRPMIAEFELALIKAFCSIPGFFAGIGNVWNYEQGFLKQFAKCLAGSAGALGAGSLTAPDPPPPAWQGVDGTGQTIGIVAFDTFATSDVQDYLAFVGLPPATLGHITRVPVGGGAAPGANQSEVLLDIALVATVATNAAIKVYDAPAGGGGTYQAVFNAMINGGVTVISNSWAYCEDQTTLADVRSIDTILQAAAASGISVVNASGDRGTTCLDGHAEHRRTCRRRRPTLTAVGGTSMTLGPGFTYAGETWWDASGAIAAERPGRLRRRAGSSRARRTRTGRRRRRCARSPTSR